MMNRTSIKNLVADKEYDSATIINILKSYNIIPIIPFKDVYLPKNFELTQEDFYDVNLYKKRNIIERFFGRLKKIKELI